MTNGEKMQETFPEGKTRKCRDGVVFESDGWCHAYDSDWWNAEYKELTTKNCESCRYYGSHHEVCNYCYKCSLWTEGEPTAKDDLTVDLISRADVIRAIEDVLQSDNCDYDLIEFLADLKDIPSVTPQEPKPMVEIDLYSVIKQKYIEREVLDKIRAEITELSHYYPMGYDYQIAITRCLEVIDKYKAESEE